MVLRAKAEFRMDTALLNYFVLPPIVFEAGYALSRKAFARHLWAILTHALVGTAFTVVVVAGLLQATSAVFCADGGLGGRGADCGFLGAEFVQLDLMESLVFGSLLCAVDPTAMVQVFGKQQVKVDAAAEALIVGVAEVDDVLAFVLFTGFKAIMLRHARSGGLGGSPGGVGGVLARHTEGQLGERAAGAAAEIGSTLKSTLLQGDTPGELAGLFLQVTAGSAAIGLAFGVASALFFRVISFGEANVAAEVSLFLFFAFAAFLAAELPAVGGSGALALLLCSFVMASYARVNISEPARRLVRGASRLLAKLAEMGLYLLTGMVMVTQAASFSLSFTCVVLVVFVVGRALAVFPLCALVNACSRANGHRERPAAHGVLLFLALSAPTISIGLCLEVPSRHSYTLASTTSFIVFVTVLFFGGSTTCAVKALGLHDGDGDGVGDGVDRSGAAAASARRRAQQPRRRTRASRAVRAVLCRPEGRAVGGASSSLEKEQALGERAEVATAGSSSGQAVPSNARVQV